MTEYDLVCEGEEKYMVIYRYFHGGAWSIAARGKSFKEASDVIKRLRREETECIELRSVPE